MRKVKFSAKRLTREIMQEGKVLQLHPGAVEIVAGRVAHVLSEWAEGRVAKGKELTQYELDQKVARELKKYNPDLAYLYQHRGRMI